MMFAQQALIDTAAHAIRKRTSSHREIPSPPPLAETRQADNRL